MKLDADTLGTLERARRQLFQVHRGDPNFTGCGIGFRRRGGRVTDEPVVIAMVINKRPVGTLSSQRLLPRTVEVDGQQCGVDVVSAGPLTFSSTQAVDTDVSVPITGIFRPPLQGCSISNVNDNGSTGTFGCLVTDNSDGTLCLLGSNHVLARDGAAVTGEVITQPALGDGGSVALGIGFLKQAIAFGSGTNDVDAAIAQLTDQGNYSQGVVGDLMAPISPSHPAVGMVVADDSLSCGTNCYLSRMDLTVTALGLTLLAATDSSSAIVEPEVGMAIEKVGRTTGYTSSTVDAVGAQVKVNFSGTQVTMSDMIWTESFSQPGDSGAVVCQGGNGETYASSADECGNDVTCALLSAIGTYYNVPLGTSANNTLADEFRDNFLAQSNTGQLLIGTTYLNMQVAINRLNTDTGTAHNQSIAQARAQALYSEYHALAATLITSASPKATVTSSQVNGVASILFGLTAPVSLGGAAMLTADESAAAWNVYSDVLTHAVGMDRQQLIDYLNESTVFQTVRAQLAAVPTILVSGTISAD